MSVQIRIGEHVIPWPENGPLDIILEADEPTIVTPVIVTTKGRVWIKPMDDRSSVNLETGRDGSLLVIGENGSEMTLADSRPVKLDIPDDTKSQVIVDSP